MRKRFTFKAMAMVLSAIAILFAFSACGNKNANRFKEAAMNLDKTHQTLDGYDDWPETGIRNTGSHLASLISLEELQKLLPCPLYLSGPHHDGEWDLYSDDFGHYNPEAIQYLADLAKKVVSDKKFVAASKPLVDNHLFHQMHSMMVLHDVMYSEDLFDEESRDYFFNEMVMNEGYIYGLYDFLDLIYVEGDDDVFNYYKFEFLYFWARRWSDGTIDQFYDGLSTIFKAYYPDYEFVLGDYFYIDDDWFEEEMMETAYSCDLEPDEPVQANERIKENDAVNMFRNAASNLDKTSLVLADEFDYWPECGIRVTGGHLFSLISLKTLNKMLPCDLYVSGPHHYNRWELDCPYDFGHYNPEAVSYLGNLAKKVVADKAFVAKTKPLVDKYLKRQMTIMKGIYDGLNNKDFCDDKEAVLEDIVNRQGNIYMNNYDCPSCGLLGYLDLEDGSYVYGNTGEMFLYFWGRRYADGTMEQFHDILETLYNAYYPQ